MAVFAKTVEFQVDVKIPAAWLECLTRVWNEGLYHLNWLQTYSRHQRCESLNSPPAAIRAIKRDKVLTVNSETKDFELVKLDKPTYAYCCDIVRDFRVDRAKSWNKENLEQRFCCDLVPVKYLTKPEIDNYKDVGKLFAKKRCDWVEESGVASDYLNCFIRMVLLKSWESYSKGVARKPKYRKYQVNSLVSGSFRAQCKVLPDDHLKIPGFGKVKVNRLRARLLKDVEFLRDNMARHPEQYPEFATKLNKAVTTDAKRLAKASGIDQPNKDQVAEFKNKVSMVDASAKTLEYFSAPGSFCLLERDGKTYLQITAFVEQKSTITDKVVGVDSGLDYLISATNGLKVEHPDFTKEQARIDLLNERLSKKRYGSANYNKLLDKIRKIHGKIKRSRKGYQAYWAQQLADVNQSVAIKEIKPSECVEVPSPIYSPKADKYLPNGRGRAKVRNRELIDCSLSQFQLLTKQQCDKRKRNYVKVEIEPEATKEEVLEAAEVLPAGAASELAQNSDSSATWEGAKVTNPAKTGKGKPTSLIFTSDAGTPKTCKRKRKRRQQ